MVAKLTVVQQAIFDKLVKHRHLKALYMKGLVDGKPMNKMLVDGGASVNLMPYPTCRGPNTGVPQRGGINEPSNGKDS